MPDFRSTIDHERERQGLTVYALATRARVSERALGLFLRGQRECRSDVLTRLLSALSLTIAQKEKRPDPTNGAEPPKGCV